ncbi:sigma-70 family RNA polymerase sigma factor [Bifidobacterium sp. CP2]|nr:sigma-70 family RNA polymerase sigma factor [Bifidobacterium sp. CP2]
MTDETGSFLYGRCPFGKHTGSASRPGRRRGVRWLQWATVTTPQTETLAEKRARFERLAMPALDALYRRAMRLTNNPDDAQDLVQDTFEKGFKAFDSFQPGTNFEAWMTTIERNTYFNQYAKAKRRPQRANDADGEYDDWDLYAASEHSPDALKSAEDEYLDAFAPEEIMDALAKLSPERRQVFIDAAIDGKSYQQVADEQGVKIGTVMSRLNRARTQLKRELASYAREHGYGTKLPAERSGKTADSPKAKSAEIPSAPAVSGHNGRKGPHAGASPIAGRGKETR